MLEEYFNESIYSFNSSRRYLSAILAAVRGEADVAIVMAHISAEAFFSELFIQLETFEEDSVAKSTGHVLRQLEESRVQLPEKIKIAHQLLFRSPMNTGSEPYQSFQNLVRVRNVMAHPKREHVPRWFQYFVQNDLILAPARTGVFTLHWYEQFSCPRCAKWACRATRQLVSYFLDALSHLQSIEALTIGWNELLPDPRID